MNHIQRKTDLLGANIASGPPAREPAPAEKEEAAPVRPEAVSGVVGDMTTATAGDEPSIFETRLLRLLQMFWSNHSLIGACTGIGLLLGVIAAFAMGPSYSATAVIQPSLMSEAPLKGIQAPALDANLLLESEIQLITLQPLPKSVVTALNRDLPTGRGGRSFRTHVTNLVSGIVQFVTGGSAEDEAERLASSEDVSLDVGYRKRTYLIEVTTRASTPERAAAFANAVAGQYARQNDVKQIKVREMAAQQALGELMLSYGDSHPSVLRAQSDLARLRHDLEILTTTPQILSGNELAGVVAVPAQPPTSPNSSYKMLAVWGLLGLFFSLGYILFQERKRFLP